MSDLTHLDAKGRARMVDVSGKPHSARHAVAAARVRMRPATAQAITSGGVPKGDVLAVARLAGVMAAKRTAELIPLCHQVPLSQVEVECTVAEDAVEVRATASTVAQTGVEMEALVAVSAACLAVYDMCKAIDREMVITDVRLLEKTGGTQGDYRRADPDGG